MGVGEVLLVYIAVLGASIYLAPRVVGTRRWKLGFYGLMALAVAGIVLTAYYVLSPLLLPIVLLFQAATGIKDYVLAFVALVATSAFIMYLVAPFLINAAFSPRPDPYLQGVVDEVAARIGRRVRAKAVVVDGPPNAFAYGNFLSGRYVAVTTGLLKIANQDELRAVIGHELGHHANRDNEVMSALGILPSLAYYTGAAAIAIGLANRERPGLLAVAYGVVMIVVSFIIQLLVMAFSRLREYYADMHGARAAGKEAMMSALAKIHQYYKNAPEELQAAPKTSGFKALFIYALVEAAASPFADQIRLLMNERTSWLEELLSSHPPIPKRLRFLAALPAL
ncbi:MAG: zinc metalloprotease HtpX [Pyrobaculum arsenaticum]|uniref:Heat shock protein, Metallo peptidase, MEROPS family M48B n=1 Tax=Pyrobaculum arsenaticum (strain DSM 13514 / JCM 11321 / PZ6) TaxID=340102 RepID=A4WLC9_PYRAR|nr:zinc metalloprotease HtpX [Pyrobaculum arsenaticum]ABP51196.1 Heat shock protein, Metallo peptidase, MEROPS family M48B [Pyrobaculum arsenaticum DSM 13514]MCY0890903.1 zinc metalloprotease HtpX [Pyrobaculum arsenaticum]